MRVPRRGFLKSGTLTAITTAVALRNPQLVLGQKPRRLRTTDYQIPIEAQQDPLFYFTAATFNPYVGDIFQAPNARGQMVTMTLLRVSVYKVQPTTKITTRKTRQPDSFSLTFRAEGRLPQFTSIHKVSHPALGAFDLFLTPREAQDGTLLYEAVFNHIR